MGVDLTSSGEPNLELLYADDKWTEPAIPSRALSETADGPVLEKLLARIAESAQSLPFHVPNDLEAPPSLPYGTQQRRWRYKIEIPG